MIINATPGKNKFCSLQALNIGQFMNKQEVTSTAIGII